MNANTTLCIANDTRLANADAVGANNCIANIGLADNNSFAKERNIMNAFKKIVTHTAALLGFCALAAIAPAAHADVVIDDYIVPSHNLGASSWTTDLKVKLYNSDNYSVSGVKAQGTFYLWSGWLPILNSRLTVSVNNISMAPYEEKWVTLTIPAKAPNGMAFLGQNVTANLQAGASNFSISFLDAPPAADNQITEVDLPSNHNPGSVFIVYVTNNGYAVSKPEPITLTLWADADGPVSKKYTLTATVLVLPVGGFDTVMFTLPK